MIDNVRERMRTRERDENQNTPVIENENVCKRD